MNHKPANKLDKMPVEIRPLEKKDWPAVKEIFEEGINTGISTLETEPPDWEQWDQSHLDDCRLVAEEDHDRLLGWAALSPVSNRCVYEGVAEVSVYVTETDRGKGIGTRLMQALVKASEESGIWTLQAGIFPENKASIRVHQSAGFRIIGRREKLGMLNGKWQDILLLERRSDNEQFK